MKELTETNEKLAAVRKAQATAAKMDDLLGQQAGRHFDVVLRVSTGLPNWNSEWPEGLKDDRLDEALRAGFRANLKVALSAAFSALRAEERRLCEELVRLAAKTAAGGL